MSEQTIKRQGRVKERNRLGFRREADSRISKSWCLDGNQIQVHAQENGLTITPEGDWGGRHTDQGHVKTTEFISIPEIEEY